MTLPHSHQSGASAHRPFDISTHQVENHLKKTKEAPVVKMPSLQAQERFLAAFNVGSSAKLIVNDELKIIDVNKSFKQWLGSSLPENINDSKLGDLNIFKQATIKELQTRIKSLVTDNNVEFISDVNLNGNLRHLQITVGVIALKGGGEPWQYLVDINDITELEQNKSEWSESKLQLGKQDAIFRKVARVISHDLRAPTTNLSNLIGLLENAENAAIDPELLQGLKTSVGSILSSLNSTGLELNSHLHHTSDELHVTIGNSIEKVLESIRIEIKSNNVEVRFEAYDTSDWEIPDELLKMVLTQLVSNSIKFCTKEKAPIVNISAFKQDGSRIIRVSDNGVGIDLKGQEQRLFGLFQTFHEHPEARGVGLFQVKNRMKSIGGDVLLESEVGEGTTVTLNFN